MEDIDVSSIDLSRGISYFVWECGWMDDRCPADIWTRILYPRTNLTNISLKSLNPKVQNRFDWVGYYISDVVWVAYKLATSRHNWQLKLSVRNLPSLNNLTKTLHLSSAPAALRLSITEGYKALRSCVTWVTISNCDIQTVTWIGFRKAAFGKQRSTLQTRICQVTVSIYIVSGSTPSHVIV